MSTRPQINNTYPEEFKINAVAVVRSKIMSARAIAFKIGVPQATLNGWLKSKKYSHIQCANEELLSFVTGEKTLVKQPENTCKLVEIKQSQSPCYQVVLRSGNFTLEFSNGLTNEQLKIIVQALKEGNSVL